MTCKFVQRRVNEFGLQVATNFFLFIPALSFVFFSFYFYPIPTPMPSLLEPVQKEERLKGVIAVYVETQFVAFTMA